LTGEEARGGLAGRATAHLWIESPRRRQEGGIAVRVNRLFGTHPPLEDRIRALEAL
jgi:Zn-dependent protease with chaperone function